MKFTSLSIPYFDRNLGLYACDITQGEDTSKIYANTFEELKEKKRQIIIENLQIAKEELANWPSLNK